MEEQEFDNPFVPAWQMLQQEIDPVVAAQAATESQNAVYSQDEYDKVFLR